MDVFDYADYKIFLTKYIKSLPSEGRGTLKELSEYLGVHTSLLSQILRGTKNLSLEQAFKVGPYFGFSKLWAEAFLLMVQIERAGSYELKNYFRHQFDLLKEQNQRIDKRVQGQNTLSEADKARFYSSTLPIEVFLLTSIPAFQDKAKMLEVLEVDSAKLDEVLEFLVEKGLCRKQGDQYQMLQESIHLSKDSPLVFTHHQNWRLKAMETYKKYNKKDLSLSAPISISKKDFEQIQKLTLDFIEQVGSIVKESEAENLFCLNIDLFSLYK